jgi:hypothetical protein
MLYVNIAEFNRTRISNHTISEAANEQPPTPTPDTASSMR